MKKLLFKCTILATTLFFTCSNPTEQDIQKDSLTITPETERDYQSEIVLKIEKDVSLAEIDRFVPGQRLKELGVINGYTYLVYRLTSNRYMDDILRSLNSQPAIVHAEKNHLYQTCLIPNDTRYAAEQYAPHITNCEAAWDKGIDTGPVIVAVLDTGINGQHEELTGRVLGGFNFISNYSISASSNSDDNGHGTHVTGIIGANGNNNKGIAGLAWQARFLPVKVLDNEGSGNSADLTAGIIWAVDHGARLINLSLGSPEYSSIMNDAVQYALAHNTVVIASMGNSGTNERFYPAAYPGVIAVGCTNSRDVISSFSSTGSHISLAAPGENICSLDKSSNAGYRYMSGTSMAAPFVTGTIALMAAQNPALSPAEIKSMLEDSASDKGAPAFDSVYGHGRIDVSAALDVSQHNNYGSLKVRVTSYANPLANLPVIVRDGSGVNVIASCLTNTGTRSEAPKGEALFNFLPAGNYNIMAAAGGEVETAAVTVTAGNTVTAQLDFTVFTIETFPNGSSTLVDTGIYLYNDSLQQIGFNDDAGEGLYSRLITSLSLGQTYYIKIISFPEINSYGNLYFPVGSYSLLVSECGGGSSTAGNPYNAGEPDNSSATAATISRNVIYDRYMENNWNRSDEDWFKITLPVNPGVAFSLSAVSSNTDFGTVTRNPNAVAYDAGTTVILTATPKNSNYRFDHWEGDLTGITNPASITMDAHKTITGVFVNRYKTLHLSTSPDSPAAPGNVSTNPTNSAYLEGTNVTLTANAYTGYKFDHWEGDLSGTTSPATITMDRDKTITAVFIENPPYVLEINRSPAYRGSISINPYKLSYTPGENVVLTANNELGYNFDHWEGDLTGTSNPATVVMDHNKYITAVYCAVPYFTLTTNRQPSTAGYINITPGGYYYNQGTPVTLTATGYTGYKFDHWEGDLTGTNNPATITIDNNKTVTAVFISAPVYTLTLHTNPSSSGGIYRDPYKDIFTDGERVVLTANNPGYGYVFDHWEGDATGTSNPLTVIMDGNKDITAVFLSVPYYSLTCNRQPTNAGYTNTTPSGSYHNHGSVVTVTATSSTGYKFDHWEGDLTGTTNPTSITMDANKIITAVYIEFPPYVLNIYTGAGSITRNPNKSSYNTGESVTLTANNPAYGYLFDHWEGDLTGTNNPATISMDRNKNITAVYISVPSYSITRASQPASGGNISLSPLYLRYNQGTIVTSNAIANPGYTFDHWEGDLTGTSNPATITVDGNKTITAVFIFTGYIFETFANGGTPPASTASLYLYDNSLNQLAYSSYDATGSYPRFAYSTAPGTTYYLRIRNYSSVFSGYYSLHVTKTGSGSSTATPLQNAGEPDNTSAQAVTIAPDVIYDRFLSTGDEDWFKITLP